MMMVFSLHCINDSFVCFSGYAHFIRGQQYWKFDPVGMNSLEGYPRYVGMDFFGCSNVWGFFFLTYGESNILSIYFLVFWQWRGVNGTETFFFLLGDEAVSSHSAMFYSIFDTQISFKFLLRKTMCFSRLAASCAATFSYLFLHICPCTAELSALC